MKGAKYLKSTFSSELILRTWQREPFMISKPTGGLLVLASLFGIVRNFSPNGTRDAYVEIRESESTGSLPRTCSSHSRCSWYSTECEAFLDVYAGLARAANVLKLSRYTAAGVRLCDPEAGRPPTNPLNHGRRLLQLSYSKNHKVVFLSDSGRRGRKGQSTHKMPCPKSLRHCRVVL